MSKEFQVMGSFGCMVSACGFFFCIQKNWFVFFFPRSICFHSAFGEKDAKFYTQMII